MKRILYIAAMASLLMTSCQKTDILNVAEDTIDFSTEVGKLTKAYDETKYATLKDQGFRVWAIADFSLGNDEDGKIYRGMENLSVEFVDPEFKIAGTSKYFWPAENNKLYFYTISALDEGWLNSINYETVFLPKTNEGAAKETVTGLKLPEFEVTSDANDDVMVADYIHQHKKPSKTVKPLFKHTMTKVMFNFKKGDEPVDDGADEASVVILKGIVTDPLSKFGNLSVTYSTDSAPMTFDWTAKSGDPQDVEYEFTGVPANTVVIVKTSGTVITATEAPANPTEGDMFAVYDKSADTYTVSVYKTDSWQSETLSYVLDKKRWISDSYEAFYGVVLQSDEMKNEFTWYMIPQMLTVTNDASETVDKTVLISYVADGKHIDQKFALKGTNVTEWKEEVCVKYNVTIAPHKIVFNPTVGDWEENSTDMDN